MVKQNLTKWMLLVSVFAAGVFLAGCPKTKEQSAMDQSSPAVQKGEDPAPAGEVEKAAFAAGCFWHVQQAFDEVPGVVSTMAGYCGGTVDNPTYEMVCTDATGHAETVQVTFDPKKVSYQQLLDVFWKIHDPTQFDRQGPDVGTQYRSVIFYYNEAQHQAALDSKAKLEASHRFSRPIVTQILPAKHFWPAEQYHQKYYQKHRLTCAP
jgi:methionine-S-sulfoxide reductase